MATYNWATWLADVLRARGLTVVEHTGWQTRGLSNERPFTPRAVVWHHDASKPGDSPGVPYGLLTNFAKASAQCWVDRAGVWHLIAAGRAPHAGEVLAGMPGNTTSIGVETDHTVGEEWPPALLDSLRVGTAAILARLGVGPEGLHFHRTVCAPVGRKIDPAGLVLQIERDVLGGLMGAPAPAPVAAPKPAPAPAPAPPAPKPSGSPWASGDVYLNRLNPGQKDSDSVKRLQYVLNSTRLVGGATLPITGKYGPLTRAEVAKFQVQKCHDAGDGDIGPKQAAVLFAGRPYTLR